MCSHASWKVLRLLAKEISLTLSSSRRHLSYVDCSEDKREDCQNCSVLCCVLQ